MDDPKLRAANGIDPETEAHFRLISSVKNTTGKHTHDFFEIFLILNGSVVHCVNGKKQLLDKNSLVFIRDKDVHYYEQNEGLDCQFINLSFYKKVIDSLFEYLGDGFSKDNQLTPEKPPVAVLTKPEAHYIQNRLQRLNLMPNSKKNLIKAEVRALLAELFSRYMQDDQVLYSRDQPDWLGSLCSAMNEKDNFIEGVPALLRISNKTHPYLCKIFKQYLNTTPIDYINSLRLSYAENLLLNTDMSILDVCLEAGFGNLSYFYERFRKQFNTTPYKFRKENSKTCFILGF